MPNVNQQTVSIYRGEDVAIVGTATATTSISGWSLQCTIRRAGSAPALTLTTADSEIALTNAATGVFTVNLTRAQTLTLTASTYDFDVFRTDSGSTYRLCGGQLLVKTPAYPTS